jgi:SAM-dependent methyltransferase
MEGFRPLKNTPPDSFIGKSIFFGRMLADFQILTIYRDLKKNVKNFRGSVLDVGCGQSPYRHLIEKYASNYTGIDIVDADKFDYNNSQIVPFNGEDIPFESETFDSLICTEVLEHVFKHQKLVDEMFRVMRPGAFGFLTVPWSARFHYIPYDFFRYTPSSLKIIFSKFDEIQILNRGTDIPVIANKILIMWLRGFMPRKGIKFIFSPFWLLLFPFVGITLFIAHISILMNVGNSNDPLGYTIIFKKQ